MFCYVVRHGKDDETVRGGWSQHSLVPEGVEQVRALGEEILGKRLPIARIYSSDIQRAKETALILQKYLDRPVEFVPEFREANNGYLAGLKHEDAEKRYPGVYWGTLDFSEPYPGGESPQEFFARIQAAWADFKVKVAAEEEDVLLVTHGGVVEAILCIENGVAYTNQMKHFKTPAATLFSIEIVRE